jgi:hypothetical protein
MNRRDFLAAALQRGGALALVPAVAMAGGCPVITPAAAEPAPALPVAPLGPPPFCVVPRGFDRGPDGPFDLERSRAFFAEREATDVPQHYGYFFSMAGLAEEHLGRWPATWGEVVAGAGVWLAGKWGSAVEQSRMEEIGRSVLTDQMQRAGLRLEEPTPSWTWLREAGGLCHEWTRARGRFADGCSYRLPHSMEVWEALRDQPQDALVRCYEDAGAPWGHTREAAALYLWNAGGAPAGELGGAR